MIPADAPRMSSMRRSIHSIITSSVRIDEGGMGGMAGKPPPCQPSPEMVVWDLGYASFGFSNDDSRLV